MTAPARKPEGQIKTILIFAVLGPPIAAVLLVLTTIPLPNRGSEIAILLAIAVVLGYRVAFFPLLISGVVATVMVGELKSPLLRTAATIATAMILTYFFTVQMGAPRKTPVSLCRFTIRVLRPWPRWPVLRFPAREDLQEKTAEVATRLCEFAIPSTVKQDENAPSLRSYRLGRLTRRAGLQLTVA